MNGEISEYISDCLEAAISALGTSKESISTEDLLSAVDKSVEEILSKNYEPGDIFIGSLDVSALYPSLDIEQTAKICGERFAKSGVKLPGVDWYWISIYVALTHPPEGGPPTTGRGPPQGPRGTNEPKAKTDNPI